MSRVGQRERATRNREETLLRAFLKERKVSEALITKALYELNKVAGDQNKSLYDINKRCMAYCAMECKLGGSSADRLGTSVKRAVYSSQERRRLR